MSQYYCDDPGTGERHVYGTLQEALEDAEIALKEYHKAAEFDGEWDMSVENLTVGLVAESGDEDDDIATHRTRYVAGEEEGTFDVVFGEIEKPSAAEATGVSL